MTDATAILIAAIPPTITSLGALVLGYINRRKIEGVAHALNHVLDNRIETEGKLGTAMGKAAGIEQERNRPK